MARQYNHELLTNMVHPPLRPSMGRHLPQAVTESRPDPTTYKQNNITFSGPNPELIPT